MDIGTCVEIFNIIHVKNEKSLILECTSATVNREHKKRRKYIDENWN